MQFSNTTSKDGIIQQIEFRTNLGDAGISGDATLLLQFTGQINDAHRKAFALLLQSDGVWKVDDTNHTDAPRATTDLTQGQSDYKILTAAPSTNQDWLQVTGVNVKNSGGQFYKLFHKADRDFVTPKIRRDDVQGQPYAFWTEGTQVYLDAEPNYSQTGGIEVLFDRAPLEFASTDTTKRPGFASLFHEYLVLVPVYWWEKYKRVGDAEQTKRDIMEMEKAMGDFYNDRHKFEPVQIRRSYGSYRRK